MTLVGDNTTLALTAFGTADSTVGTSEVRSGDAVVDVAEGSAVNAGVGAPAGPAGDIR